MIKPLLIAAAMLLCGPALATERERAPHKPPAAAPTAQAQTQTASPTTYAPATNDSAFYALPSTSLAGGALSSAMCTSSSYTHRSYIWGLFASADGQARPDMECISLVSRVEAMRALPTVAPQVQILTAPPVMPAAAACGAPGKPASKPKAAAAPKAKACT